MDIVLTFDREYKSFEEYIKDLWRNTGISELFKIYPKNLEITFLEGPPFISGKKDTKGSGLHTGHALISYIKSTLMTYFQMKQYKIDLWTGTDNHGLPMETLASDIIGLKTPDEIRTYGIANFNKTCKGLVDKYESLWDPIYESIGRHIDLTKRYRTKDTSFMESVIWVFKTLYDKGLIYEGLKILPYSYKTCTTLSNFEANQEYKEINEETLYVYFPIISENPIFKNTGFVAWTTTPWTLPANVALCLNPTARYIKITFNDNSSNSSNLSYIICENFIKNITSKKFTIIKQEFIGTGNDLINIKYVPPFDTYNYFNLTITDDFVDIKDTIHGTGIVHIAPAFGEIDFSTCIKNNIITSINVNDYCPINDNGEFTDKVPEFKNILIFDANKLIIKFLRDKHIIVKTEQIAHSYPHSPRTHEPLIYKACTSYFVAVTKIKEQLIENNKKVNWHPLSGGAGRFSVWLENVCDWCISRNRFFGTPIPIWETEDKTERICIGSINELQKYTKDKIIDLHSEFLDKIIIMSPSGKPMHRINFTLDCWFESGSVPYGQIHYPFENKNAFDGREYLSDFVCEGIDQTRGWFYTLLVLSTALFNKPPFKHVICSGLVLDKNGKKLSKNSGNFIDPQDIIEKYGSDSYRLYLLGSSAVEADNLKFDEDEIKTVKQKLIQYINGVIFFTEYYNGYIKKYGFGNYNNLTYISTRNILDKWIISRIEELKKNINNNLEHYIIKPNILLIYEFIEDLTNYYIKLNRNRLKGINGQQEQLISLTCLQYVIVNFMKLTTPFMPFLSEYIYDKLQVLEYTEPCPSIKLCEYPQFMDVLYNQELNETIKKFKNVLTLTRATRSKNKGIESIRRPVNDILILHSDKEFLSFIDNFKEVIKTEVNALNIRTEEINKYYKFKITLNLKNIARDYKQFMKEIKETSTGFSQKILNQIYNEHINNISFDINVCDSSSNITLIHKIHFDITPIINYVPETNHVFSYENGLIIDINTTETQQVIYAYSIRQVIINIQEKRKDMNLHNYDKIVIDLYVVNKDFYDVLCNNLEYINNKLNCSVNIINSENKLKLSILMNGKHIFDYYYIINTMMMMN